MRVPIAGAALLAVFVTSCGVFHDPSPERRHVYAWIEQGGAKSGALDTVDTDGRVYSWDIGFRDLPEGFTWTTTDVDRYRDGVDVSYELRVADQVPPGRYEFRVDYEFKSDGDLFTTRVKIYVSVLVYEVAPEETAGETLFVVRQRIPDSPGVAAISIR